MGLLPWLSSCGALPGGILHGEQKRGDGEGTVQHDEGKEARFVASSTWIVTGKYFRASVGNGPITCAYQ